MQWMIPLFILLLMGHLRKVQANALFVVIAKLTGGDWLLQYHFQLLKLVRVIFLINLLLNTYVRTPL